MIENTPPNNNKIHVLFKCTQNILKILFHFIKYASTNLKELKLDNIFSDPYEIKLDISKKRITANSPHVRKLTNTLLNNLWFKEEGKEKLENVLN